MKTTSILSKTTTLALTALVFLSSLPNHTRAIAQEVETQAVAGSLDPTFGEGGKVTTPFAGGQPPNAAAMRCRSKQTEKSSLSAAQALLPAEITKGVRKS